MRSWVCWAEGGGRRALRLLMLLVMSLAALEYLCGFIFETSPLRKYFYMPLYNARLRSKDYSSSWHKRLYKSIYSEKVAERISNQNKSAEVKPHNQIKVGVTIQNYSIKMSKSVNVIKARKNYSTYQNINYTEETKLVDVNQHEEKKNYVIQEQVLSSEISSNNFIILDCKLPLPSLGPVQVNKTKVALASIENKYPEVEIGGRYKPRNCTAKNAVAIIIPFRNRDEHLSIFLNHMHSFLMKQQLDYGIFVIEQKDNNSFNRAKLFNVGFVESNRQRPGGWQCFIFHDVDLLPTDERNVYSCPSQPRHMSVSIDKHNFKLMYKDLFGGVSAMTYEQFTKVNGFPNDYWGWGGEDDDMSYRVRLMYKITRYNMSIARYTMLDHKQESPNPERYKLLSQTSKKIYKDGLSSLKYKLVKIVKHRLFTLVSVNLDAR